MADATIIPFPMDRVEEAQEDHLTCIDCCNVYLGSKGLFCGMYREPIIFEQIAEECPEFESLHI